MGTRTYARPPGGHPSNTASDPWVGSGHECHERAMSGGTVAGRVGRAAAGAGPRGADPGPAAGGGHRTAAAGHRRPWRARRPHAAPARLHGVRRGCVRLPRRRRRPARRAPGALGRAAARPLGDGAGRTRRRTPRRWSARRSARRSRSPACCWPGRTPRPSSPTPPATDWEADRAALVAHDLAFADFLARRDLVLRSDLLGPWARWITPEFEERRYDTWFFLALLPRRAAHPRRLRRGRPHGVAAARRGARRPRPRRDVHAAADPRHAALPAARTAPRPTRSPPPPTATWPR